MTNNKQGPQTRRLMMRVRRILDRSEGKITIRKLSRDLGKLENTISEWLGMRRSAPNAEATLQLCRWADKHEKTK